MTIDEAVRLIETTAASNRSGRIGGPFSAAGYDRKTALTIAGRCVTFERRAWHGQQALVMHLPGHGDHVLYLTLTPPRPDPWA